MCKDDVATFALSGIKLEAAVLYSPACGHMTLAITTPSSEGFAVEQRHVAFAVFCNTDGLVFIAHQFGRNVNRHFLLCSSRHNTSDKGHESH